MIPIEQNKPQLLSVQSRRLSPVLPHEIERPRKIFPVLKPDESFHQAENKTRIQRKTIMKFAEGRPNKIKGKPTVNKPVRFKFLESSGELPIALESSLVYDSRRIERNRHFAQPKGKIPLVLNSIYNEYMDKAYKK